MLDVCDLVKCYTDVPVVKGISFSISDNGVYGFLGPNGAGKSTTMNMITGCLAATSGIVRVGGHDIYDQPRDAKRMIGYLPEQPPLYLDMTPWEYLSFVASARGVPKDEKRDAVLSALDVTGLTPVKDRMMKHLSKGYRQRVGISETLLGNPRIIILDEPTVGLDPKQITEVRELIRSLGKEHIVLLSSHIMQEVQAVSDHVMIIARGRLLLSCRTEELEEKLRKRPQILLRAKCDAATALRILEPLDAIANADILKEEGNITDFTVKAADADAAAEALFHAFSRANRPILRMEHHSISLEEAFLELTSDLDTYGEEHDQSDSKRA